MTIDEFLKAIIELGISLNKYQMEQLEQYYNLLIEWNQKINLTTITEKKEVYLKHFYDSLTINKGIDLEKQKTLCDIGTGAGFPGIVLKIAFPNLKITLIDSLNKRIQFLNEVICKLNLQNIEAIHTRIEEYSKIQREKYDIVTVRAVSHLSIILEYGIPLLQKDKYLIAMKGNINDELKESQNAFQYLNCLLQNKVEFDLPFASGHRTILFIQKLKVTNLKYPRKYSEIKKNRL